MTGPEVTCGLLDAHAEELALGVLGEPLRGRLIEHTNACAECRDLVAGIGSVVDRLLILAPECEPPAGFESRVLAKVDPPTVRRFRTERWLIAIAVVLAVVAGVAALWESTGRSDARTSAIVTPDGGPLGSVQLVAGPRAYVLVTIDHPRPGPGRRTCELLRADATWVEVGSWEPADVAGGVWAAGIDDDLLDARAMRIRTLDGTVLATADW